MKKLLLFFFFSCLFFEAVAGPSLSHGNWRWRNDDGSETNATWKGAENQEVGIISADEVLRLRIKIASQAASGLDYSFTSRIENQIGYSRSADGPFTTISATDINSEHFVLASSDDVQGGAATTEQLTPGVGGNFRAGQVIASSTPQGALVFNNESIMKEFEWVLQPTATAQEGKYYFKIIDESIGQPGTLPSVLYTTSPQNKPIAGYLNGLQFDGVNDYVEIPSQPSNQFNSETEFTVSLWFKANSMAVAGLFNRPSGGGDMQFWLTAADGKFTYGIDKHGYGWTWISTPEAYKVGEWVQVTTVRRNVSGQRKMEIYADGVLVGSGTVNLNSSASSAPIRIGTYMNADGGFANAQIDNVSLWGRALTAAEIKTLGATTLNGNEAGLAGYWRFDETTGTIAYDATSNANHGTLKNMDLATARVASTAGDIKTYENVAYSGKLAGSDPDGKPLSYSLVTSPAKGTIVLNSNGNYTYTPAANVAGTDAFSYSVSNGTDVSNTATVNVTIVAVNKAPVPAVAELPIITAECAVTVTAPTANDDNDGVITGVTADPVHYTTQGSYTITWTYSDSEGLTSTQTQQVIIKDATKPVFAAVSPIMQTNDADKCGAVVTYPMPTATDNCSSKGKKVLLIWDEINTNTTSLKNALTAAGLDVVLSATSETGYNGTNPSLTGFDAVIHLNGTTYTAAMPAAGQTALLDFVVNKGGTYITNEWSAYEIGSMALMRDILVLERTGNGFTGGVTYSVVASQVGHPILQDIPASFNLPSAGANTGGTRTYSANQPIALMTSPHGVAVAVREFSNGGRAVGFQHAGNYNGSAVLSDANAQKLYLNAVKYAGSRNGTLTITQTAGLSSGVLFPVGKTTNTFTATDRAGNTTEISFDVTVTDTQKPNVLTQDITVELDASGKATIAPSQVDNGSTDNCSVPADGYSLDIASFTCEDIGTKTVTLTVTDANGNSQNATATVTVIDPIKPTITAPAAVTVNTDAGKNTASTVPLGTPTTADNCSGASITNNAPAIFPLGNTTVTWTATDAAGNKATATQVVTVADKEAPVPTIATLPTVTSECSATVSAPTATDNVTGPVTGTTIDPTSYTEQGTYTITWTYTDGNGNSSTQTQQVVVDDVTAPVVGTIASKTIAIPAGQSANWNMYRFNFTDPLPAGAVVTGITLTYSGRDQGWGGTGASARIIVSDTHIGSNQFLAYSQNFTINFTGDVPGYVYGGNNFMRVDFDTWPGWEANFEGGTLNIHYEVKTLPAITGECSVTVTTIPVAYDNCGGTIAGTTTDPLSYTELGTYSIRWSFDDGNGNIFTSKQQVIVTDTQKPQVITQNITVELDATGKATITPAMIDDGSTDNCSIPAGGYSLSQTEFTCADLGANIVTLRVTDVKGNSETATVTVTVVDPIKPTITAPAAVTVNTDPGKNTASGVVLGTPATADNCSGLTLSNNAPAAFPMGNTTVTWTATDAAGNTATATQVITVADKVAPVPTVATLPIITGQCAATVTAVPSANDNVLGNVPGKTTDLLSYTEQGTYTITWTYTDAAGNTSTQTQQVIVKDDTAPVVKTRNITVELGANGKAGIVASDVDDGSRDNCGVASYKVDIAEFGCSNLGANVVTLTVTDVNGNEANATATITVVDTTKPVAAAKGIRVALGADGKATITAADIDNNSSDNCGIASITLSKYSFNCSNIGANEVVLTVTDVSGNVTTATATVTLEDNVAPTVVTRTVTAQLDATGKATITANQINNGSSDNCGIAGMTLDKVSFSCQDLGDNEVALTVTDMQGNVATATAVVKVVDTTAPIARAKNVTLYLRADGTATLTPEQVNDDSADNCAIALLSLDKTVFDCSHAGENTVTLTVTDGSGNSSSAIAVVTVVGNVAPVAIAQNITVTLDAAGKAIISATDVSNGSTGTCGIKAMSLDKTTFDCSDIGKNTVTLTVTDVNNNLSTATAVVTVADNTAPVVLTKNITVELDANGNATIAAADLNNGSADNCGIASVTVSRTAFDCSHVGVNDVVLTVTDVNGNAATATAQVTVEDKVKPNAVAKNITVYLNASGTASITAADIDGGSQDVCSEVTLALDKATFNCTNIGENTVTLLVTDASGNRSTATATVTVLDNVAPIVRTRHLSVQLDAEGKATITAEQINDNSSDNCGIATVALDKTTFDCSQTGANTVTLTVTDQYGNSASAPATVTVLENIAPVVLTRNITVALDATGKATITANQINNGSSDNCSIAAIELSKTDFGCQNLGENTVTLTVTDKSGNKASATATITVEDNTAPIAMTRNLVVQLDASGRASITAAQLNNGSSDNCGIETVSLDKASFSCEDLGENTVTLTVTDKSGNQSMATATVTIEDKVAPVVIVQHITIQLNASGAATITAADINKGSSDNCGIASMSLSKIAFDCGDVGTSEVVLTVTDGSGNVATGTAIVTVEDMLAPVVMVKNLTVQLDAAGSATITAADLDNGSADNCGIVSLSLDKSTFGCEDTGDNKVTLTVTDASGNQATAVATVTVEDKVAPIITAPVAVVVNVDAGKTTASNVALGEPAASDNCSVASVTNDAPVEFPTGTTTVTWTVTDASGNSTTATQTVTVRRDIVSVANPAQINVPIRTTYPSVPLPGTVMVTYSDGATEAIGVVWAQGTYNGLIAGIYPLTGQLTLADGTTNLRGLTAQVIVEVEPNIAPTALAFSATSFKPEVTADEVIGTLSTTDPDDTEFVYTLASGEGDTHNALFGVRGDQVYLKSNKGLSGMTSFTIRVRSTDPYQNSIERTFTLTKQAYDRTVDQLKIVNAFSPNGDGVNDNWTIPELRFYNQVYIQVFDRSGVRVFETTDPEKGWDGRGPNGKILKGPFLFTVEVRDINWVRRGVVTILGK